MGIGIVLIFWLVVFAILAAVLGSAVRRFLAIYLRRAPRDMRRWWTIRFALFPAACVVFAAVWFVAYAVVNDTVFHHDPGIGDGWYTDLGDGYAIDMIDVTDEGIVHPTGGESNGLNSPDALGGVRRMQTAGRYIFGARDFQPFSRLGTSSTNENGYFVLDTSTRKLDQYSSEAALREQARALGFALSLEPIDVIYNRHRLGWFDWVAAATLCLVPVVWLFYLVRGVSRAKRSLQPAAVSSP